MRGPETSSRGGLGNERGTKRDPLEKGSVPDTGTNIEVARVAITRRVKYAEICEKQKNVTADFKPLRFVEILRKCENAKKKTRAIALKSALS